MFEVEVKLRIDDPEPIRRRIAEAGAEARPAVRQADTFYQHPVRDFVATDEALRVREVNGARELTYKGPRRDSEAKVRQEENVPLGADPTALLEALGFRATATLVKRREPFVLPGVEVALDHVEGLGWFAEVEVVGEDVAAAEGAVEAWVARLGLADAPRLQASYLELAQAAGAASTTRLDA